MNPISQHPAGAIVPVESATAAASPSACVCPLCQTVDEGTSIDALAAGADWTCKRCGQKWNAARLVAVAAFERYSIGRLVGGW